MNESDKDPDTYIARTAEHRGSGQVPGGTARPYFDGRGKKNATRFW